MTEYNLSSLEEIETYREDARFHCPSILKRWAQASNPDLAPPEAVLPPPWLGLSPDTWLEDPAGWAWAWKPVAALGTHAWSAGCRE